MQAKKKFRESQLDSYIRWVDTPFILVFNFARCDLIRPGNVRLEIFTIKLVVEPFNQEEFLDVLRRGVR